jgi:hypothetical protein
VGNVFHGRKSADRLAESTFFGRTHRYVNARDFSLVNGSIAAIVWLFAAISEEGNPAGRAETHGGHVDRRLQMNPGYFRTFKSTDSRSDGHWVLCSRNVSNSQGILRALLIARVPSKSPVPLSALSKPIIVRPFERFVELIFSFAQRHPGPHWAFTKPVSYSRPVLHFHQ